jgi:hypothetical protein
MSKHEEVAFLVDFIEGLGLQTLCSREVVGPMQNNFITSVMSQGGVLQRGWYERSKVRVIDPKYPALVAIDRYVRIQDDMIIVSNKTRSDDNKELVVASFPLGDPNSFDKLKEVLMAVSIRWV